MSVAPWVSVKDRLKDPNDAFTLGVQTYFAAPLAGAPASLRAEQETGTAVFSVAVYFASVNGSPVQPLWVALIFIVWTAGSPLTPGSSVTLPGVARACSGQTVRVHRDRATGAAIYAFLNGVRAKLAGVVPTPALEAAALVNAHEDSPPVPMARARC